MKGLIMEYGLSVVVIVISGTFIAFLLQIIGLISV